MKKKETVKRFGALALSALMVFGSTFGSYATETGMGGAKPVVTVVEEPEQSVRTTPPTVTPTPTVTESENIYSIGFTTQSGITIVPEKESYKEGETVNFSITNTSGKEITEVSVLCNDGQNVEVSQNNGVYSFVMPAGDVSISVKTFSQTVNINATIENAQAAFDKGQYEVGDTVNVTLTPNSGYELDENQISLKMGNDDVPYTVVKNGNALVITFVLPEKDVLLTAKAVGTYSISLSYKDMYGADAKNLFDVTISPQKLNAGTKVSVSVNYKGNIGWMADVSAASGSIDYEMTANSLSFTMPAENVSIAFEEMEEYDKGDLSGDDTALGEDIGKKHDVTTSKEYEPDITLGKTARWEDIEKGLAELTLTESDTSDWSDNPSDYIIVLDRTRTMAVDDKCFWSENDSDIGLTHSVCLNPQHFYLYQGKRARLIDYQNGYYIGNTDELFKLSSNTSAKLWEAHYNASGTKIRPSLSSGCYDRLTLAQNGIKDILSILEQQNKNQLAGGLKNRVMYWSFSGPTYKNMNLHPDGLWNEVPDFTSDITAAKSKIKYESYAGTYYNNSFDQVLEALRQKQSDKDYKDIPTKVIFISDGLQSDTDKSYTTTVTNQIKAMPNTKIYTILIGNAEDSAAGKLLKKYASSPSYFATVNRNWQSFVDTITAIQQDQYEMRAVDKVLTDKINTKYWEVVGEPILEKGNGTAKLNADKTVLTWNIPTGEGKTYTCKLKLKLKDEYRYLISDTVYPTNLDNGNPTDDDIKKNPDKAGAVLNYSISGGKYNLEERKVGIRTPELKYGTVEFDGEKKWTVSGATSDRVRISLKRTMPDSTTAAEVNNAYINVTNNWKYHFNVRRMPDGTTYPLIMYNNEGKKVTYAVSELVPEYFKMADKKETVSADGKVTTLFYNEPFKVKARIEKIDEETKKPLSGAEFSVYVWSKKEGAYVPYKGTNTSLDGAADIVRMQEISKGVYETAVWLYYSADNMGKYRIVETKAPNGYFGDWKNDAVTNSDSDKNVYDITIPSEEKDSDKTITVSNLSGDKFGNQRVKGEVTISKHDRDRKEAVAQGSATLAGAVYKLYAAEDLVHQDGSTGVIVRKDAEVRVKFVETKDGINVYEYDRNGSAKITTGADGQVKITGLELGKYYVKEVSASEGYLVDTGSYAFEITYAGEKTEVVKSSAVVYEPVKKQALSFYKLTADNNSDQLDPMKGAKFTVYLVDSLEGGRYKDFSDAEVVQAAIDDLRNSDTLLYDTYKKYAPAVVYAENTDPDVAGGKLVKSVKYGDGISYTAEGEHAYYVSELVSDDNGVVRTPALPYGRYVVIETETPDGKTATRPFIIHVTADDDDKTIEGDGGGTPLQDKQLTTLIDRPIMSLIRLMKRDDESKKAVLKEGAAYIIHDVEGAWFKYISNEMTTQQKEAYKSQFGDLVAQYSQGVYYGTKSDPFVTKVVKTAGNKSANVYIETPMQLPTGTYELEEIIAPEGYILQGHEGVIAKDNKVSGNGTYYEKQEDGRWQPTPQGRKRFTVSSLDAIYDETTMSFVTVVKQDNDPAVGKISIFVDGEALVSAEKPDGDNDYEFTYDLRPVEGAEFEIRAVEDIYSQEGGENAVKIFSAGDLVATLRSDKNGQTWTGQEDWEGTDIAKGLPLGKYSVVQTVAGKGFYLPEENKVPREIEISYAGQEVPVIYRDTAYTNPRQNVKIEVIKTDIETKQRLAGAVFGLYAKDDIVNYEDKTVVKADELVAVAETTASGSAVNNAVFAPDLPLGRYYVKELKSPYGYTLDKGVYDIDASYAGQDVRTVEKNCEVQNQKTKHIFVKTDIESGVKLSGAQFEIYEILTDEKGNLLKDDNGGYQLKETPEASWTSKGEEINYFYEKGGYMVSIASPEELPTGKVLVKMEGHLVEGLAIGKQYILREVQAPEGYVGYAASSDETREANRIENTIKEEIRFTVSDTNEIIRYEVKDQRVVGNIVITKEGEFLVDAEVGVLDSAKNIVSTAFKYLLGRMENVTFAVYVKDDIHTPDGTGNIAVWTDGEGNQLQLKKDTLVAEIKTGFNGIAKVENLPLGIYYIREVSVGDNEFFLNTEVTEAELAYQGQDIPVVGVSNVTSTENNGIYYKNERQHIDIRVYKKDADTGAFVEGAQFGLFAAEDITAFKLDPEKAAERDDKVLIAKDTLIETVFSNKDGLAEFKSDLPCGKYYVKELCPPEGYTSNPVVFDIDGSYTGENGKDISVSYEVKNQKTKIVFAKTDIESGVKLSGAQFEIYEVLADEEGALLKNEDGSYQLKETPAAAWTSDSQEYNVFYIRDDMYLNLSKTEEIPEGTETVVVEGHLVEGLVVNKYYVLREVQAPEGYAGYEASSDETREANKILNKADEEILFQVSDSNEVVEYEVKDQRVVGTLAITKEGEFLTDAELSVIDSEKNLFSTVFKYLFGRVENVTFEVQVKEDILTPDGAGTTAVWTNADGETIELKAGTVVAQIKTDAYGVAMLENLPLGTYLVKEISVGEENELLISTDVKEVTLAYEGQDVPVVYATGEKSVYFLNERQRANISLYKYRTNRNNEKVPVEGAVFGLFTAEDIFAYTIGEDKTASKNAEVLIAADTPVARLVSGADGYVKFAGEIPGGKYYVKELQPADGFLVNDEVYMIDATYTGENGEKVLSFNLEVENKITSVGFRKVDIQTGKCLGGASLEVIDKASGETVAQWTSKDKTKIVLEGLKLSDDAKENIYVLRETRPADGYVTAKDIEFKLVQDKDTDSGYLDSIKVFVNSADGWKAVKEPVVEMKDDVTKVEINKIDKEIGILITGAKLEIRDGKGNVVAQWTSSEDAGYYIEKLPVGTYTIVETGQPYGYKKAEKMQIEVKDTPDKQVFVFENIPDPDAPRLDVEKSTIEKTKLGDNFEYSIDVVKNLMAASVENFTLTDVLPEEVELKELCTGTYNQEGKITVEYKTGENGDWKVWKEGLSTLRSEKLSVADLGLAKGEKVTSFRMRFGTVKIGFANITAPVYIVTAAEKGDGKYENIITLSGTKLSFTFLDKDSTVTVLEEEKTPGGPTEDPKKPDTGSKRPGLAPKTGDASQILLWAGTLSGSALGSLLLLGRVRKKDEE